jgi:hypothetical protein
MCLGSGYTATGAASVALSNCGGAGPRCCRCNNTPG